MNARGLRRYVDDLLRGRRPRPFHPDDFEAAQIRTAIDLKAARLGGDAPSEQFLDDLRSRLGEQMGGGSGTTPRTRHETSATRRQVIVGTSAAAAAAVAAVSADRLLLGAADTASTASGGMMTPNQGSWQVAASSAEVTEGDMHPFQLGPLIGFVRRVNGRVEAISGVCTHQGCRLWFDKPADTLRCPCHTTSFTPTGDVRAHQLPTAPRALPRLDAREVDGSIEVLAPLPPAPPTQRA